MHEYLILCYGEDEVETFMCSAENTEHAVEQALDAYDSCTRFIPWIKAGEEVLWDANPNFTPRRYK